MAVDAVTEDLNRILKDLLAQTDWSTLAVCGGTAERVPERFLALVESRSDDQAKGHYWTLDNSVVVQGRAFRSAVALLPAIFTALSHETLPPSARRWLVELLTEIALGSGHENEPNPEEIEQSIVDLVRANLAVVHGLETDNDERVRRAALEIRRTSKPTVADVTMKLRQKRAALAETHGFESCALVGDAKVGIARNVRFGLQPINGVRLQPEEGTTGWFIWAGGEMSDAPDFFEPLHASHLAEWCPEVLPFLELPPGWRFLVASGYEDVWHDDEVDDS